MTTNESYHTTYDADAGATGDATDCYVDLDGVTARKSKTLTDDGILQLEFVVHSTRSEPVRLEIRDALPQGFPLDRVGFCPDYGQEKWSVGDNHELVYESKLEPRDDERTVYAVKPNEQFDPPLFSIGAKVTAGVDGSRAPADAGNGPEMATTEPVSDDGGEAVETETDDKVEPFDIAAPNDGETTAPSTETQPSSPESMRVEQSTDDPVADGAVDEAAFAADSNTSVTTDTGATGDATPRSGTHEDHAATTDGGIVAQLTTELEERRVSDEELAALEVHLSRLTTDRRDGRTSLEARLQRAERELNELSAYTDALSEFLDERGAGQELLDELEAQAAEVQSRLEGVSDEVSSLDERLETVEAREDRLDAFDDRFGDVTDRLDEITDRLDALDDRQDGSDRRLDDLADRQDATTDRLETVTGRLDSVDEHVGKLDDELAVLRTHHEEATERIARTQESVDALDDRLDSAETERAARTDALSDEIDSVAEEVEEIRRWHRDFGRLLDDFGTFGRKSASDDRGETTVDATGSDRTVTNGSPPPETDASADGDEATEADVAIGDGGEPTDGSSRPTDAN